MMKIMSNISPVCGKLDQFDWHPQFVIDAHTNIIIIFGNLIQGGFF